MSSKSTNIDLRSLQKCVRCGTCRSVCPVFEELGWESCNTRGRIMVINRLMDGYKADGDVLKSLNSCTTCGICAENCPAEVKPYLLVESARRELISRNVMTKAQAQLNHKVVCSGNVFNESSNRLGWLSDSSQLKDKADYVYFVGCLNSYRYPQVAAKTFKLLKKFGATLLSDEQCCGSPMLRTGFQAQKSVEHNLEQIRELGAHTVITGCAGCYTTLKNDYPPQFKVLTVSEFLAEHISELNLKPLKLVATYHDPCHMGRHNQIYDPPRQVIEAICHLQEMNRIKEDSRCCGGGGGVRAGYKDLSLKLAENRLKDVPQNADCIVTTCPLCIKNLTEAGASQRVIDLVDLVSEALEDAESD